LVQVIQPIAPVLCDDAHTQVSRVSIGSGFDTSPRFGWQRVFFVSGLPTFSFAKGERRPLNPYTVVMV
jgi:hypothetical protein